MPAFPLKSAALAAATAAGLLAAGTASAQDQFNGCLEIHWTTFGEAVAANDPDALAQFLQMHGPNCEPLRVTALALLCDADPAACLVTVEPAAGEPDPLPEDDVPNYTTILSDFAYRGPGEHIGSENNRSDNSSPGEPGGSSSAPAPSRSTPTSSSPSVSSSAL